MGLEREAGPEHESLPRIWGTRSATPPFLCPGQTLLIDHSAFPAGLETHSRRGMPRGILRARPGTEAKTRVPLRRGMSVFQAVSLVLRGLLKVALVDTRPHARCACVGNAGVTSCPLSLPARPWERTPVERPRSVFTRLSTLQTPDVTKTDKPRLRAFAGRPVRARTHCLVFVPLFPRLFFSCWLYTGFSIGRGDMKLLVKGVLSSEGESVYRRVR